MRNWNSPALAALGSLASGLRSWAMRTVPSKRSPTTLGGMLFLEVYQQFRRAGSKAPTKGTDSLTVAVQLQRSLPNRERKRPVLLNFVRTNCPFVAFAIYG